MRTVAAIAALIFATGAVDAADRALVIGINAYPNIRVGEIGGQRDLFGAVNDARTIADMLAGSFAVPPENILLLLDDKATRQGIIDAFRSHLVEASAPGDRVIFYYAGHGAQVTDDDGDEDDGLDEVLVPHDAVADLGNPDGVLDNIIRDDEIGRLISQLHGREVTIIVDACHSGTITRDALAARANGPGPAYSSVRTITPFGPLRLARGQRSLDARLAHRTETRFLSDVAVQSPSGVRVAVWTAVGAAQFALEDMSIGGSAGLFTSRMVRGIADLAADLDGDGEVTPAELIAYLRGETDRYCASYDCLGQDPLPTLEAWDGYAGSVLATRNDAGTPTASLDPTPNGGTVVRTGGFVAPALPKGVLPATPGQAAAVVVSMEGGERASVGQRLHVAISSAVAGRLLVLDSRDDGTLVQLFPNAYATAMGIPEFIEVGDTFRLPGEGAPYAFIANKPGRGVITAIVVDRNVQVGEVLAVHTGFTPIIDANAYGGAIAAAVGRAIVFSDERTEAALEAPARAPELSRGQVEYEIVP